MPIIHECTIDIRKEPFREPDTRYGSVDWAFKYPDLDSMFREDSDNWKINLRFITPNTRIHLSSYPRGRGDVSLGQTYEYLFASGKINTGESITGDLDEKRILPKGWILKEERSETVLVYDDSNYHMAGEVRGYQEQHYDSVELTPNLYIRIDDILDFLNCDHKFSEPIPWKGGLPIIADWVQDRVGDDDIVVKRLRHLIESKVMV